LNKIGVTSFSFSGITTIIFNKNIETIGSYAFSECYQLKEVNLVDVKIKTLKCGTFSNCNLESIYLPKLLIKMEEKVFGHNPLKNIFCYSNNPPNLIDFSKKDATFSNVDIKECIVHVPKGKTNIYKIVKGWRDFNSIIADVETIKQLNLYKYFNL